MPETRQWGVARVNTGQIRHAVYSYDQSPVPGRLRVEGLDYLRAVVLTDQEPPLEQTPLVEPAVKFALHSERVTSAAGSGRAATMAKLSNRPKVPDTVSARAIRTSVIGLEMTLHLAALLEFLKVTRRHALGDGSVGENSAHGFVTDLDENTEPLFLRKSSAFSPQ
ncbi:MAG: hypothetical protein WCT12_30885 [Verrucomicrobiota bacterium]